MEGRFRTYTDMKRPKFLLNCKAFYNYGVRRMGLSAEGLKSYKVVT
jgi:hypothetical protein